MRSSLAFLRDAAFATACALLGAQSFAATVYTSESAFLAAVAPGAYTETFNSAGNGAGDSFSFSGNGFGYTITASTQLSDDVEVNNRFIENEYADSALIVTFTSGSPTAIGGNFFVVDGSDDFQQSPVTINLSGGTSVTFTPSGENAYEGFTSDVAITSLTLSPELRSFNAIDNLTVGLAAVTVPPPPAGDVPEPASDALLLVGAAALVVGRKRSRRMH